MFSEFKQDRIIVQFGWIKQELGRQPSKRKKCDMAYAYLCYSKR